MCYVERCAAIVFSSDGAKDIVGLAIPTCGFFLVLGPYNRPVTLQS
jgi:hypothetical protein